MTVPANVILVGFMGSGKTSVASLLARRLGFEVLDMDRVLEEREGMPVAAIFREKGEAYFRSLERGLVDEVLLKVRRVVATGGGAWADEDNRKRLLEAGWCVWLKASPDQIWSRVRGRISDRPILAAAPDPRARIRELMESRRPAYEKAPHHVDTDGRTPEEVTSEICDRLREDHPFDLPELQE
jgi:shikimate kinase